LPQGYALPPCLDKGWAPGRPSGPSSPAQLAGGEAVKWNLPMAGAILAALPTLLVYIFLGRYFLRGLLAGSMKG